MFRFLYRLYFWLYAVRRWYLRRFTPLGLGVLGLTFITAMMGPDTENNVAYQAFALSGCLLVLAVLWSPFFRGRFSATRLLPRFGTVGHPLRYHVRLRNLGRRPQRGLTLLETWAEPRPSYRDWLAAQRAEMRRVRSFRVAQRRRSDPFKIAAAEETAPVSLEPGEEADVPVEMTPARRGLLRLEEVTVARTDPLGLFRAFVRVPAPQTALILPRRYALPPIALPGTRKYQQGGVALASNVGLSDEFVALRDYRRGDPLRHIHWRSWAKAGKPVVREFEDEFFVRHALVLDTFIEDPLSQAFEEAVSVAASFACTLQTQESLLDLLFVGTQSFCFTAGRGVAHSDQMLEILAAVSPCRGRRFEALEHLVLNHVSQVSGCVCVLLAWDEDRRRFIEKLRLLGLPLLVIVITEARIEKPVDPGPMREDPARFHVLAVGQVEPGLARLG
jgi:uncharacterized protein (DUF58 family)